MTRGPARAGAGRRHVPQTGGRLARGDHRSRARITRQCDRAIDREVCEDAVVPSPIRRVSLGSAAPGSSHSQHRCSTARALVHRSSLACVRAPMLRIGALVVAAALAGCSATQGSPRPAPAAALGVSPPVDLALSFGAAPGHAACSASEQCEAVPTPAPTCDCPTYVGVERGSVDAVTRAFRQWTEEATDDNRSDGLNCTAEGFRCCPVPPEAIQCIEGSCRVSSSRGRHGSYCD